MFTIPDLQILLQQTLRHVDIILIFEVTVFIHMLYVIFSVLFGILYRIYYFSGKIFFYKTKENSLPPPPSNQCCDKLVKKLVRVNNELYKEIIEWRVLFRSMENGFDNDFRRKYAQCSAAYAKVFLYPEILQNTSSMKAKLDEIGAHLGITNADIAARVLEENLVSPQI